MCVYMCKFIDFEMERNMYFNLTSFSINYFSFYNLYILCSLFVFCQHCIRFKTTLGYEEYGHADMIMIGLQ